MDLPDDLPDQPGARAPVAVTRLWLIGGRLIVTGLIALGGAYFARPAPSPPLTDPA